MRILMSAAVALATSVLAGPAQSQDWPQRQVTIVVPFSAGGTTDMFARILSQGLAQKYGTPFVVDNRAGAGGNIGAAMVARAAKDGHTLLVGTVSTHAINPFIYKNLAHDTEKDFQPVSLIARLPNMLVVNPKIPAKTVAELIEHLKKNEGKLSYGSSGAGTSTHLASELFQLKTGTKMVHVPYAGSNQAVADLLTGRVQVMFSPASTVLPHVQEGKLIALASTQLKRASVAPDLPTMEEAGLKGFDTSVWSGLMAPAGTPPDVIDKLARAINEALKSRDVIEPLQKQGIDVLGGTPKEFADYVRSETAKWSRVVAAAGMKQ